MRVHKVLGVAAAFVLACTAPVVATATSRASVETVSPVGTTIDVFNYSTDGASRFANGINGNGHFLQFNDGYDPTWVDGTPGQDKILTENGKYYINAWTGKDTSGMGGGPFEGIVQDTLGSDGYPVLANDEYYNRAEYRTSGNQSLAYLFNPEMQNVAGRETYVDAGNLLYINDDNYFEYDSDKYYARLDTSSHDFSVTEQPSNSTGFFPFNDQGGTKDYHSASP